MVIEPKSEREKVVREYDNVPTLIRKTFDIPDNEMILDLKWDKEIGRLVVETLKD